MVLSLLRIPAVGFSVAGYYVLKGQNDPMVVTVPHEVASGLSIIIFGGAANLLLLARKPLGITVGYLHLFFTLLSFGLVFWQITFTLAKQTTDAARVGAMIGFGAVVLIRLALWVLYLIALRKFAAWHRRYEDGSVGYRV